MLGEVLMTLVWSVGFLTPLTNLNQGFWLCATREPELEDPLDITDTIMDQGISKGRKQRDRG